MLLINQIHNDIINKKNGGSTFMKVIRRKDERKVYTVIERSKNAYAVVKVLNMYKDENEVLNKMVELVQNDITEEDLLNEFTKSDW